MYEAGGIRLLAQRMIEGGYLNGETLTVTGKTLAQEASTAVETPNQKVVLPLDHPVKDSGGLVILKGNLATTRCSRQTQGHRTPTLPRSGTHFQP
jgi:dihydroxy-acid dehydratase